MLLIRSGGHVRRHQAVTSIIIIVITSALDILYAPRSLFYYLDLRLEMMSITRRIGSKAILTLIHRVDPLELK
jgi:hypothetical protein